MSPPSENAFHKKTAHKDPGELTRHLYVLICLIGLDLLHRFSCKSPSATKRFLRHLVVLSGSRSFICGYFLYFHYITRKTILQVFFGIFVQKEEQARLLLFDGHMINDQFRGYVQPKVSSTLPH